MPRLSVYMIRTALLHLGIGFLLGALALANKGVPFLPQLWRLVPIHVELLIFGWMIQLAMGVAFYALPRFQGENRYGHLGLGWASYIVLNSGILITILSLWFGWQVWILFGYMTALIAVILYILLMWRRVKPFAQ